MGNNLIKDLVTEKMDEEESSLIKVTKKSCLRSYFL